MNTTNNPFIQSLIDKAQYHHPIIEDTTIKKIYDIFAPCFTIQDIEDHERWFKNHDMIDKAYEEYKILLSSGLPQEDVNHIDFLNYLLDYYRVDNTYSILKNGIISAQSKIINLLKNR